MKFNFWLFLYQIIGIIFSILFIYSGLFLMINYPNTRIIFGIGFLGNIFGGWALIKIIFESPLEEKKFYHTQPCDCDICHHQKIMRMSPPK